MQHPIDRIRSFEIVAPYTLRVHFDDATIQTIDSKSINQVRIDPEVQTLIWPNGADFDPATLHDWPVLSTLKPGSPRLGNGR